MKRVLFLLFLPIFSIAQQTQQATKTEGFVITGAVKGLPDSTLVVFGRPGEANEVIATAYAKGGKFTLFGNVKGFDIYQLIFAKRTEVINLFVGNEKINIAGDTSNLKNLSVTGSAYHNDFKLYLSRFDGLKNKLNELVSKANKTEEGPERDAMIKKVDLAREQVLKQVDVFVKERPTSPVSAFVVYVTSPISTDIASVEGRFAKLKLAAREGFYADELAKMIASTKIGKIGTQSVDFVQNDTANVPVKLSDFKGKYVLVDFWASWCGPCRMENPAVVAAYNQYKGKNFTILGVSLDMNKDKWLQAIQVDNLRWTQVSDLKYWQNAAAQLYRIQSIPANMLIDPDGKIVGRDLRGADLHEKLKQLLK